ncbi:MAG: hypothetical protein GY803_23235 [Chloroflexi bacterium]|nr:hypothetical protein [Chloroflexota bacterium]
MSKKSAPHKKLPLSEIVIPDRNNDCSTAAAYWGGQSYDIPLEIANAIVLQAKDDDMIGNSGRRTHAYRSRVYWAHYPLKYGNDYGNLLPDEQRAELLAQQKHTSESRRIDSGYMEPPRRSGRTMLRETMA